jgi:hypothetical protein
LSGRQFESAARAEMTIKVCSTLANTSPLMSWVFTLEMLALPVQLQLLDNTVVVVREITQALRHQQNEWLTCDASRLIMQPLSC